MFIWRNRKVSYFFISCMLKLTDENVYIVTDGFVEEDFLKLWKGLHYCLWMQDKPLIQVNFI